PALPASDKCEFHKNRDKCSVPACCNQVYARSRCVRHGGKLQCQYPNCRGNVRVDGLCLRHAAANGTKKLCAVHGCDRVARVQGKCVAHGGGRLCGYEQCTSYARVGGVCQRHRRHCTVGSDEDTSSSGGEDTSRGPIPRRGAVVEILDKRPVDLGDMNIMASAWGDCVLDITPVDFDSEDVLSLIEIFRF
ncbi:hypothetical protein As57867_004529, partial [Aphanomyces stellatus]